jgi:predicted metal-dependent peptidase
LRSNELPHLVITLDTSGSIDQEQLDQFAAEVSAILELMENSEITVIYCDSRLRGTPETFTKSDLPLTLNALGGGGTDFRPPFQYVADQDMTPAALIYLTDLDCDDFPQEPDYPVLWIKTGTYGRPAPFGEVIDLE